MMLKHYLNQFRNEIIKLMGLFMASLKTMFHTDWMVFIKKC